MKVSIIIPVYNAEKYLRECIESALNQDYKDTEIIAVNDGSEDNSLKILEEYSDRIKIISKSNGGTASALNAGIQVMQGEWFKWLSADDVLYPYAVKVLVDSANALENRENYILYSNYDVINETGRIVRRSDEPNYNDKTSFDANVILLDHYVGNGITSLIHKSAFERFGTFDESINHAEDYELWLRFCIIHKCRLYLIPKVLAKYRVHQTQLTETISIGESLDNVKKIKAGILNQLDKEKQVEYETALKKYRRGRSIRLRIRYNIHSTMFKILPDATADTILKRYMKIKEKLVR